jgi:DNA-binding NarL/FixJ family response regulator
LAGNGRRAAVARIPATKPNVAILVVRLPDGSGVEVCRQVRSSSPDIACVMLTSYADDEALGAPEPASRSSTPP